MLNALTISSLRYDPTGNDRKPVSRPQVSLDSWLGIWTPHQSNCQVVKIHSEIESSFMYLERI
jgi:hypothetical protein